MRCRLRCSEKPVKLPSREGDALVFVRDEDVIRIEPRGKMFAILTNRPQLYHSTDIVKELLWMQEAKYRQVK